AGGPRIEAVLLHQRPALAEACALLLREQWGLSVQARLVSLQRSSHAFPLSLVLLACPAEGTTPEVLGHSKLSLVVGDGAGVLAESVLIAPAHRGQGLGRRLMEETERYARSRGKHRLFLSTPDKQCFYAHLGYVPCQPV
uniref:N(alpha)-acetyltransferase 80, NatH catalytic subunit n=1 Tax=Petromyzon marinus TaxID=7757 RepID=S4RRQ8_PETMA